MRSLAEIKEEANDLIIPNQSGHIRLGLELLLDIRELLIGEKKSRLLSDVSEARKRAEEEREEIAIEKRKEIKSRLGL